MYEISIYADRSRGRRWTRKTNCAYTAWYTIRNFFIEDAPDITRELCEMVGLRRWDPVGTPVRLAGYGTRWSVRFRVKWYGMDEACRCYECVSMMGTYELPELSRVPVEFTRSRSRWIYPVSAIAAKQAAIAVHQWRTEDNLRHTTLSRENPLYAPYALRTWRFVEMPDGSVEYRDTWDTLEQALERAEADRVRREAEEEALRIKNAKYASCPCDACQSRCGNKPKKTKTVMNYTHKPRWVPQYSRRHKNEGYYLGVELETDTNRSLDPMTQEEAAGLALPDGFWTPKHDGSVAGPEFASMPATLTWWNEHRDDLSNMFKTLIHAGYRSHEGGHAGMHVNISDSAFTRGDALRNFMRIINRSSEWSRIMSQRTVEQLHWCELNMTDASIDSYVGRWLISRGNGHRGRVADFRYTALNYPGDGTGRLEFRLPRGTLRVDRFLKNLQWTAAMIELAHKGVDTAADFMADVDASKYPELAAFMSANSERLTRAAAGARLANETAAAFRTSINDAFNR